MPVLRLVFALCVLVLAVTAMQKGHPDCECPMALIAIMEGKTVVSSGTEGVLAINPCCMQGMHDDTLPPNPEMERQPWNGDVFDKHTPGSPCSGLKDCAACTLMDFCLWGTKESPNASTPSDDFAFQQSTGQGCIDINHVAPTMMQYYSHTCSKYSNYGPAEITGELYEGDPKPEVHVEKADPSLTEKPSIVQGGPSGQGWPAQFDGYLPPQMCHHSNQVDPRPECGDADPSVAFIYPQWLGA